MHKISLDITELGSTLRQLRRQRGVSQQSMAEDVGISRMTMNGLEKGRVHDVGFMKVLKILDYLGYELHLHKKSRLPTFEELRDEK